MTTYKFLVVVVKAPPPTKPNRDRAPMVPMTGLPIRDKCTVTIPECQNCEPLDASAHWALGVGAPARRSNRIFRNEPANGTGKTRDLQGSGNRGALRAPVARLERRRI